MVNNLTQTFDRINNWLAEPSSSKNERHLWIFDRKTKEISWKSRKVYSKWQIRESGRIQEIFQKMAYQLPSNLSAENKDQFHVLLKLKSRIDTSYKGFFHSHRSIFGIFYRLFFAYSLENYYGNLTKKLEKILLNSIKTIEIASLTATEIDTIATLIKKKSFNPSLHIDWEKLSFEQFKAAYILEKHAEPMTLSSLNKEKTTYLLEQNKHRLDEFTPHDIEQNIDNVEPRFLAHLKYPKKKINVSKFSLDHIIEILKTENTFTYSYSFDLTTINPTSCSSSKFVEVLNQPSVVKNLPAKLIVAYLKQINPSNYENFNGDEWEKVDFSQFTGDQFLQIKKFKHHIDAKHIMQLDLNHFSAENIKEMSKDINLINQLSPQTVADNIDKFEVTILDSLSLDQIHELNIAKMTIDQITPILKECFTKKQWLTLDLSKYTIASIAKLLNKNSVIIKKLSPATVAANLSKIPTKYYYQLTDEQLKEIDYLSLNAKQKAALSDYEMQKMKNYPKHDPKKGNFNPYNDVWWDNFFSQNPFSGGKNQSNPFSGFGFNDHHWWGNFSKNTENTGTKNTGTKNTGNQKSADAQFPNVNPKLKSYDSIFADMLEKIKKLNTPHSNAAYENLRLKCLNNEKELRKNPKLVFVDDTTLFDANLLKKQYQKLVLAIHPDKNADRGEEATEFFKLINEAYKFLTT